MVNKCTHHYTRPNSQSRLINLLPINEMSPQSITTDLPRPLYKAIRSEVINPGAFPKCQQILTRKNAYDWVKVHIPHNMHTC